MDNSNSKILTLCFASFAALIGVTLSLLIKSFAGAFGVVARLADSDLFRHGFPVGTGLILFLVLQFNPKVKVWAEEVIVEVKKVVWPSQKDMTAMTIVVVIMVLISSVIVSSFDFVSGYLINIAMK